MTAALFLPCGDMSLLDLLSQTSLSGGGLDELPTLDMLAPSATLLSLADPLPSQSSSHSDVVSESESRDVVLGGDKWSVGVNIRSNSDGSSSRRCFKNRYCFGKYSTLIMNKNVK